MILSMQAGLELFLFKSCTAQSRLINSNYQKTYTSNGLRFPVTKFDIYDGNWT